MGNEVNIFSCVCRPVVTNVAQHVNNSVNIIAIQQALSDSWYKLLICVQMPAYMSVGAISIFGQCL